jgi:hypothetical protein
LGFNQIPLRNLANKALLKSEGGKKTMQEKYLILFLVLFAFTLYTQGLAEI